MTKTYLNELCLTHPRNMVLCRSSLKRIITFDKLFALCDYYLNGKTDEHSRHLYDILKMMPIVKIDENLKQLFLRVREERKEHKTSLSAQDDVNMKSCLQEIVDMDIYKKDFESITIPLIFETISYDEVKLSLQKVIYTGLFE